MEHQNPKAAPVEHSAKKQHQTAGEYNPPESGGTAECCVNGVKQVEHYPECIVIESIDIIANRTPDHVNDNSAQADATWNQHLQFHG